MTDRAETPAQGAVRVLAITGLLLTGLGAAFLLLAIRVISTDPYFAEPSNDVDLLLLGATGAFVGACVAFYGLLKRVPGAALAGAAGQARRSPARPARLPAPSSSTGSSRAETLTTI